MKFVRSVAEGNSKYAKELFIDKAVLFGYLDGKLEHGSIEQFYHNVDTVSGGDNFQAGVDVVLVEETFIMSKKIVVITGSPRKKGNSFAMTEAFVRAAA